tara:strand:+ start:895 stop:1293 length:399 start_codon:yes stop_codon:yes gene_type:complete
MDNPAKGENVVSNSEEIESLGGRIFNSRKKAGLSLHMTANLLGVRPKTLQSWENDQSEPRVNKLVSLSGILGVSPTYFLAEEGNDGENVVTINGRNEKILELLTREMKQAKALQKEQNRCLKKMELLISKLN